MAPHDKQALVADIEKQHGERLRRFLASRLRHRWQDVPDLVQEVFLRLAQPELIVQETDTEIRIKKK